jgi:hypothetical protein
MAPLSTRANILLLPMLAWAAGCAPEGSFPSLAPRAVERLSTDDPVRIQAAVPSDPALSAQVALLLARARQGQAEFQAGLPAARAGVARAGAAGSDAWVEAQQAVSRLEGARAETAAALTELDSLSIERAARPTNAGDFQALLSALEVAQGLADAQKGEIERLQGQLRPI